MTFLVFLAIMMALYAKDYYLAPIYPMLFAGGGVAWEKFTAAHRGWRWLRLAVPAAVIAIGLIALPLVVPILPVEKIVPEDRSVRGVAGHYHLQDGDPPCRPAAAALWR